MRIVFSILHYKDFRTTSNCIDSLLNLDIIKTIDVKILVVDNPSGNDSGEKLKNLYKGIKNIIILSNDKNLGFTNGNNKGFYYAKYELKADIIIVMNNDILIEDRYFLKKLCTLDEEVDIIAPSIYRTDGVNQNPFRISKLSLFKIFIEYIKINILFFIYKNNFLAKLYLKKKNLKPKAKKEIKEIKEKFNIVPHGAFIIYLKNYIYNADIAFVPGPFLYAEEDLLAWFIKKKKFKTLYTSKLRVEHLESTTTSKIDKDKIKNFQKIFKFKKESILILLKKEILNK